MRDCDCDVDSIHTKRQEPSVCAWFRGTATYVNRHESQVYVDKKAGTRIKRHDMWRARSGGDQTISRRFYPTIDFISVSGLLLDQRNENGRSCPDVWGAETNTRRNIGLVCLRGFDFKQEEDRVRSCWWRYFWTFLGPCLLTLLVLRWLLIKNLDWWGVFLQSWS